MDTCILIFDLFAFSFLCTTVYIHTVEVVTDKIRQQKGMDVIHRQNDERINRITLAMRTFEATRREEQIYRRCANAQDCHSVPDLNYPFKTN